MPKRAAPPAAVAPITTLIPPLPPSPLIQRLRQDWRWAGISQFIWTFSDAFGLIDWDIENLEADLDGDESQFLPDLLAKLLYALTYNRQINRDNAFENLRKQYIKRAPDHNLLGTIEEPVTWATLGLSQKVGILWELCEWQLVDPARFRALLKNEEEATTWRVDPIGWDKDGNTYFLFDDNRLWIQRIPPRPPRPAHAPKKTSLKAKRAERALKRDPPKPKTSHKKKAISDIPPTPPIKSEPIAEEPVSGRRKRTQVAFYGNPTPTAQALKRGGAQLATPQSSRGTRSSARRNGDPGPSTLVNGGTPSKVKHVPLPLGTRLSRRLRNVDDEWQQVPDEWLSGGQSSINSRGKGKGKQKRYSFDEESELSDLTDEEEHEARLKASVRMASSPEAARPTSDNLDASDDEQLTPPPDEENESVSGDPISGDNGVEGDLPPPQPDEDSNDESTPLTPEAEQPSPNGEQAKEAESSDEKPGLIQVEGDNDESEPLGEDEEDDLDEVKMAVKQANELPEGFIEWEAICVTLYDWRTFPEQFAKSRHPDEKALYKMLATAVGPTIIEALVAKEQERLRQEAIVNRKRSSRIATRELEREEILRRERATREMEERMEASRREETRAAREEAEAITRDKAREDRLKEREERAAAREEAAAQRMIEEQNTKEQAVNDRESRKRRRRNGTGEDSVDESSSAVGTPVGGPSAVADSGWELACEICRKTGWNIDEDLDLVCCDDCSRWQHTECHDRQDRSEGKPKRNWDKVDFKVRVPSRLKCNLS